MVSLPFVVLVAVAVAVPAFLRSLRAGAGLAAAHEMTARTTLGPAPAHSDRFSATPNEGTPGAATPSVQDNHPERTTVMHSIPATPPPRPRARLTEAQVRAMILWHGNRSHIELVGERYHHPSWPLIQGQAKTPRTRVGTGGPGHAA